jgi:hypothetical protein
VRIGFTEQGWADYASWAAPDRVVLRRLGYEVVVDDLVIYQARLHDD